MQPMLPTDFALSFISCNISGYIAGYIGRQLMKSFKCSTCKLALVGDEHISVAM